MRQRGVQNVGLEKLAGQLKQPAGSTALQLDFIPPSDQPLEGLPSRPAEVRKKVERGINVAPGLGRRVLGLAHLTAQLQQVFDDQDVPFGAAQEAPILMYANASSFRSHSGTGRGGDRYASSAWVEGTLEGWRRWSGLNTTLGGAEYVLPVGSDLPVTGLYIDRGVGRAANRPFKVALQISVPDSDPLRQEFVNFGAYQNHYHHRPGLVLELGQQDSLYQDWEVTKWLTSAAGEVALQQDIVFGPLEAIDMIDVRPPYRT
jgi:hypothetical protein